MPTSLRRPRHAGDEGRPPSAFFSTRAHPHRDSRAFAFVLVLSALSSCARGGEEGPPELRPSAVLMLDVGETRGTGSQVQGAFRSASVADLARDGDRVVASVAILTNTVTSGTRPVVFHSEDTGGSWVQHDLPVPGFNNAPESHVTHFGVQASGGEVSLVAWRFRDGAGGLRYTYWLLMDVDLGTNVFTSTEQDTTHQLAVAPLGSAGAVVGYGFDRDPRSQTMGTMHFAEYQVAQRAMTARQEPLTSPNCMPLGWVTADGNTFTGYCAAGFTGDVCRVDATPRTALMPRWTCVPRAQWPASLQTERALVVTPRGARWVFEGQGHVYAAGIDAQGRVDTVDLGAGTLATPSRQLAPRFGGLLAVDPGGGAPLRLFDLTPGGLDELTLPLTPCVAGRPCGASSWLEALLPLGGDSYLAFYVVDALKETLGHHPFLYSSREQATRQRANLGGDGGTVSALPGHPEAMEATKLEKLCAMARSCVAARPRDFFLPELVGCVDFWSQLRAAGPAQDTFYEKFLATPLGNCPALFANWPALDVLGRQACTANTCAGSVIITECGSTSTGPAVKAVRDCGPFGAVCRSGPLPTCAPVSAPVNLTCGTCDSQGYAVACGEGGRALVTSCPARGASCEGDAVTLAGIGPATAWCGLGTCDPALSTQCVGNLLVTSCGAGGRIAEARDCARQGLGCALPWGCRGTAISPACTNGLQLPACQGNYLLACRGAQVHYLDCTELGFTGCQTATGGCGN